MKKAIVILNFIIIFTLLLNTCALTYVLMKANLSKNSNAEAEHTMPPTVCIVAEATAALERPSFSAQNILGSKEYYILAKLLYREAGSMSWEGQVWVCSAIINLGKSRNKSIYEMAHNVNMFSVAPIVDSAKPKQMQYEVIEYVVAGNGLVPEVKYFRTGHYHTFWGAKDMRRIGNVYFSK